MKHSSRPFRKNMFYCWLVCVCPSVRACVRVRVAAGANANKEGPFSVTAPVNIFLALTAPEGRALGPSLTPSRRTRMAGGWAGVENRTKKKNNLPTLEGAQVGRLRLMHAAAGAWNCRECGSLS